MKQILRLSCTTVFIVAAAIFWLAAAPVDAATQVPPPPSPAAYVNDYANLLDAETFTELSAAGRALEEKTGAELVLVTVESMEGAPIEEYALTLFRSWGLGKKDKNNGVLLLVDRERLLAGQSGKVRIEVGYGLEGAIPDGKAGYILDYYVLPEWEEENYAAGIKMGYLALAAEVAEEYGVSLEEVLAPLEEYRQLHSSPDGFDKGELIFFVLFLLLFFILPLIFKLFGRGGPSSGRGFPTGG
ncbi:MAG TPA: TPM domain-containing protein, partial [Bacillota bacterium]|nr:TPM domain-containing protein [Bacillota bacterium]